MKRKVVGLVMLSLVATAWGRGELRTSTIDGVTYTYTIIEKHGNKVVSIGGWNGGTIGEMEMRNSDKLAIPKTTKGEIVIPSSIEGMPVTAISKVAFDGCMNLTSVTIPEGVESIGYSAFRDCISLTSISFPSTLKEVDGFEDCISLTSVKIPDGVVRVEGFSGCSSLESITIPGTVKKLGDFKNCSALKSIVIPQGVTKLGSFSGCKSLATITIPNSVATFKGFEYCTSLTSIVLPTGIVDIPEEAFINCKNLTNVTMHGEVMSIGIRAFEGCTKLSSVTIPPTTKRIGSYAFERCNALASVIIPSGVMVLEKDIFDDCTNLSSIVFTGEPPKHALRLTTSSRFSSPVGIYSIENAAKWKAEMDSDGKWNGIPMVEVSTFTDDVINAVVAKARQEAEEKKVSVLPRRLGQRDINTNRPADTMRERRRLQRERERASQVKTPGQKTEFDSVQDAIEEFKKIYCSVLGNQLNINSGEQPIRKTWSEPTQREVSILEEHGFSNEVCVLAFDYLTCTQKVEEAQKDLVDYKLNETSLSQLTAEETDFYQSQVSNRIARLEELQMAFGKVSGKMPTNSFEVISFARDIRNVSERKKKQLSDNWERIRANQGKLNAMRNKISFLREKQNAPKLVAEDMNGLNVSNLVIRQSCGDNSDKFKIFSYSLTITDGRITKIEELPFEERSRREKFALEPVIPIIIEKNK